MRIGEIELRRLRVPFRKPFRNAHESIGERDSILVVLRADGLEGYGESVALSTPTYSEEVQSTVWIVIRDFIVPRLQGWEWNHPGDFLSLIADLQRNWMAKAAVEGALWDLSAKSEGRSLSSLLGGSRETVEVGVSIGIDDSIDGVVEEVGRFVGEGYRRIKVKIQPGFDLEVLREVRAVFGDDLPLTADANGSYRLDDIERLKSLDSFGLLMLEQPLRGDCLWDHAQLQRHLETPICLDEGIVELHHLREAIAVGSCRVLNLKPGRVGGLSIALEMHRLCLDEGMGLWCGGMFELGVGRAHNVALSSLPGFVFPGDVSASGRTYADDIVRPAIELFSPGRIAVPTGPGIGLELEESHLERFTTEMWSCRF